jgi:hypothetical protein
MVLGGLRRCEVLGLRPDDLHVAERRVFIDFAIRELTAAQADDLYELITERAGKSMILTANRAPAKGR